MFKKCKLNQMLIYILILAIIGLSIPQDIKVSTVKNQTLVAPVLNISKDESNITPPKNEKISLEEI